MEKKLMDEANKWLAKDGAVFWLQPGQGSLAAIQRDKNSMYRMVYVWEMSGTAWASVDVQHGTASEVFEKLVVRFGGKYELR